MYFLAKNLNTNQNGQIIRFEFIKKVSFKLLASIELFIHFI